MLGDLSGPGAVLDARGLDLVRRGIPELPIVTFPALAGLEAGLAVPLIDRRGRTAGAGITDPSRGVVRVWSREPVRAFDRPFFRARVAAALERRRALREDPETDAFRLLHGDGDGLSGFAVDAWGPFLTVQALGSGPAAWAEALEGALAEAVRPRGIVRKRIAPAAEGEAGEGTAERGKVEEGVVMGERPGDPLVVRERGIRFAARLLGARHAGLFTDMREERRRLRDLAAGRRVLNTFAYTGSFSVAAALGGAAEVVSVDVVGKVLDWAKENFRLSGIDPARHRFVRADVLEHLDRARRKGWAFDAIVLDPPTFALAGRSRWSLRRDYPRLVERALAVLSPGGLLWAAANSAGAASREFEEWIDAGARAAGRRLQVAARSGQPLDYPAPTAFPRYRYLKIQVLRG